MKRAQVAAATALLVAGLAACGSDDGTDPSEWGTGEVVGADPAASPTESTEPSGSEAPDAPEAGNDTLPRSTLNEEQATLHAEMLLFEDVAVAKANDGEGGGGVNASFREPDDEDGQWLERPDGIRLAKEYEITWSNGKINTYTLTTESGEQMTYEGGRISLDVAVDAPRDADLAQAMRQLQGAVTDWVTKHGEAPSVSHTGGRFTLSESFFGESKIAEVEVPVEGDISMPESFYSNGDYTVEVRSGQTRESARLTQDGVEFTRLFEIV